GGSNGADESTRREVEHVYRTEASDPDRLIVRSADVEQPVAHHHRRPEGGVCDGRLRLERALQDAIAPHEPHEAGTILPEGSRSGGTDREVGTGHRHRLPESGSLLEAGVVDDVEQARVDLGDQGENDQRSHQNGPASSAHDTHASRIVLAFSPRSNTLRVPRIDYALCQAHGPRTRSVPPAEC